ncbi:MAG: signal peptide peptidase SppA [Armatimonadota bacterium]
MTEQTPPEAAWDTQQAAPPPPPPAPQAPPPPPPPAYPPAWAQPPRPARPIWQWGCGFALAGCLLALMAGVLLLVIAAFTVVGGMGEVKTPGEGVALIRIEGVIVAGESGFSMFGGEATGSDDVVAEIEQAIDDDGAKAILMRVNSPGGSAAGSQEIYDAVNRARKAGKPVVVSMADVAASGGYYVSCPADVIFADAATFTGSIGVIAMHENMAGLMKKIGIETDTIKSGKLKDMGSPTGPLSDEARQVMTTIINQVFGQFVDAVAKGRKMDRKKVLALADGRVYTGQQAKDNGLVDKIGGMSEALAEAGKRGGLSGRPETKEYGTPAWLKRLFGGSAQSRTVSVTGGLLYDDVAARLVQGALEQEQSYRKRQGAM